MDALVFMLRSALGFRSFAIASKWRFLRGVPLEIAQRTLVLSAVRGDLPSFSFCLYVTSQCAICLELPHGFRGGRRVLH